MGELEGSDRDPATGQSQFHAPETSIKDTLRVISSRRWLVLGSFLIVVVLTGLWVFTRTPMYRSKAILQIAPGQANVAPFGGVVEQATYASVPRRDFIETQMRLIPAERLVEQTVKEFGIDQLPGYRESKNPAGLFKHLFSVEQIHGTWLVEVTFDWPDPKLGAKVLDYHVRQYESEYRLRTRSAARQALENCRKEKEKVFPKVEAARRKLQEFRERYNIISFDQTYNIITQDLMARSRAVSEARERLSESRTRLEQIQKAVKDKVPADSLPEVLRSLQIHDYRNQKAKVEQDLREGMKRFGENHPEIRALRAKLDSITENINLEVKRIVDAARTEHASAENLLVVRLDEQTEQEKAVQDFNKLKVTYDALQAEFEARSQTYSALMEYIHKVQTRYDTESDKGGAIYIERFPKEETAPARPRKVAAMSLASLIGLTLGVALAFLLDSLDTTLKSKEQLSRHLGLNLLGYVPVVPELTGAKRHDRHLALAMARHPRSAVAEAFRSIRTAVSFSVAAQEVRHIMVTSASPSEGKTLVSVNLAAALAQAGKKVLLVDSDLRKPALHKILEVDQGPGLTNLLAGEGAATLEDVVRPTEMPNLSFVPCGPLPPNPAELIGCERMKALLEAMGSAYEWIIIDTPPVVNVTDAAVLCNEAHGVVFVVRGFRTPRDVARRAVEILANSGAQFLGAVLNNADVPRGAYYYDKYYSYQQYYYYTEEGKKQKRRKKRERGTHKATA